MMTIPRGGRGSGTEREKRMLAQTKTWRECSHDCQIHGPWHHRVAPNLVCERPRYNTPCPRCIEIDAFGNYKRKRQR